MQPLLSRRRLGTVPVRRLASLAVLIALLAMPAVVVAGDTRADPQGDVAAGPDVTGVTASLGADELVITIEFATDPPLAWSEDEGYTDSVMVFISTAGEVPNRLEDLSTGFVFGAHAVTIGDPPVLARVVDGQYQEPVADAVGLEVAPSELTFSLPADEIGDAAQIHLVILAAREGAAEDAPPDVFPDDGWATYAVDTLRESPDAGLPILGPLVAALFAFVAGVLLFFELRRSGRSRQRTAVRSH